MNKSAKRIFIGLLGALFLLCMTLLAACIEPKQIRMRFETNGGTVIEAIEADPGDDISARLPEDPTKENYVFDGWYLEQNFSGEKQTLPTTMPEKDVTYYAKWRPAETVKLTLQGQGVGFSAEYEVTEGTDLNEFLKGKEPKEEGLTFGGWFKGNAPLEEGATMPKDALTLTAKFRVEYTLNIYEQNEEGNYPETPASSKETGWFGEPFEYVVPEHYQIDDAQEGNRLSAESLGKNETFTVYLIRETYRVGFFADAPAGESAVGQIADIKGPYGKEVVLPDGAAYGLSGLYRFAGWSKTSGGKVDYLAGETVPFETMFGEDDSLVILHAVWDKALFDAFGGEDYLFVASGEEGAVYLRRAYLEDKRGSYDAESGVFSFGEPEELLGGRVTEGKFFYFRDLAGKTFVDGVTVEGKDPDTLLFGEKGKVTYTYLPAEATATVSVNGLYSIDFVTNEYVFESETLTFRFTVNFVNEEGEVTYVFNRENSEERGFYAYRDRSGRVDLSRLFFLDGMVDSNGIGGFTSYTYSEEEGFRAALRAYYQEANGIYLVVDSAGSVLFKLKTRTYTGKVGEVTLAGAADLSDGFDGSYIDYEALIAVPEKGEEDPPETEEDPLPAPDLILDGFGKGTFRGESGTYTVETNEFSMFSSANGNYDYEDAWIVFRTEAGKETVIRPDAGDLYYGSVYYVLEKAPYFEEWKDSPSKVYGMFDGSLPRHASFYHYMDNDVVNVYVWYEDVNTGERVYELFDQGVAEAAGEEFIFYSAAILNAYGFEFDYYFRSAAEGVDVSLPFGQEIHAPLLSDIEQDQPKDALSADKYGTLTYGGKTYAYGEWALSYIYAHWAYTDYGYTAYNLAIFSLSEGNEIVEVYCMYGEDYSDEEAVLPATSYYVLGEGAVLELEGSGANPAPYIWFIDDTVLAISLFDNDSLESTEYFFFGEYEYDAESGIYTFTPPEDVDISAYVDEDLYDLFGYGFFFRAIETDGLRDHAVFYDSMDYYTAENEDGSSFELDGFGSATYTPAAAEGTPVKGTYSVIATAYSEDGMNVTVLIVFTANGEEKYVLVKSVTDPETDEGTISFTFAEGKEAGSYSLLSGSSVYFSYTVVLFGDAAEDTLGTAYVADFDAFGTYKATGLTFEYVLTGTTFTEYEITIEGESLKYAVSSVALQNGGEAPVYIEAFGDACEFVSDHGALAFDGYLASYQRGEDLFYGELAVGNYSNDSVTGDTNFNEDPVGKQVVFLAYYMEIDGTLYSIDQINFIFDFAEEGDRENIVERDGYSGSYAAFVDGALSGDVLKLDGHGNAGIYNGEGTLIAEGQYSLTEEGGEEFVFASEELNFRFLLSVYSDGNEYYYIYSEVGGEEVYVGDDWSVLALTGLREEGDGYVDATYIDAFGVRYDGLYTLYTENLVRFEGLDGDVLYFNLEGNTFARNLDDFVVGGNVLYAYQGPISVEKLTIPDGVTEIAEGVFAFMYKIGDLDLNGVEKIGDYAFYSVRELLATELVSEKLTYIGDYAFSSFMRYAVGDTLLCRCLISYMDLPNVTYIGEYAFYGNTSLSVETGDFEGNGNVKLKAIETIGANAFMITRFADAGRVLYLDLTEADLTKLTIADTAFDVHPSSAVTADQAGYPVCIRVSANGAFEFLSKLAEKYRANVEIVGLGEAAYLADTGWHSFGANEYISFTSTKGALGLNTAAFYTYASYEWTKTEALYSVSTEGVVTTYTLDGGAWTAGRTFTITAETLTFAENGQTYYKTETEQKVTVGEAPLVFEFEVSVSEFLFGTDIDFTFDPVTYNGKEATEAIFNNFDHSLEIKYAEGNAAYTVQIDLVALTAHDPILASRTVYNEGETYRATFSGPVEANTEKESFYRMTSFEKKGEGDVWTRIGSETAQRQEDGNGGFTYTLKNTLADGSVETYVVVYHPAAAEKAAYIEFTVTTLHALRNVEAQTAETYRASFMYSGEEATEMDTLTSFSVYKDYGGSKYAEEVYGADIKKTDTNTFTVTVNSASGVTVYTVVFHAAEGDAAAYITVEKKEQKVITVKTDLMGDKPEEYYYEIKIIVDDQNKIVGVTGDLVKYTYDFFSSGYDPFTVAMLSQADVTVEDMTVTIKTYSNTYTFTFTYQDDGFSATVTEEPAF